MQVAIASSGRAEPFCCVEFDRGFQLHVCVSFQIDLYTCMLSALSTCDDKKELVYFELAAAIALAQSSEISSTRLLALFTCTCLHCPQTSEAAAVGYLPLDEYPVG
jgi:hypothetical protein